MDLKLLAKTDPRAFREMRKVAQKAARELPAELTPIPENQFKNRTSVPMIAAWSSRKWLVQVYDENGHIRISVNKVAVLPDGNWEAGITWDDLMEIKAAIGYRESWAVEVYPPPERVVNVANMRHLWIVPQLQFAWTHE